METLRHTNEQFYKIEPHCFFKVIVFISITSCYLSVILTIFILNRTWICLTLKLFHLITVQCPLEVNRCAFVSLLINLWYFLYFFSYVFLFPRMFCSCLLPTSVLDYFTFSYWLLEFLKYFLSLILSWLNLCKYLLQICGDFKTLFLHLFSWREAFHFSVVKVVTCFSLFYTAIICVSLYKHHIIWVIFL